MHPERDPLQTLAAADPLRDSERLTSEEEREAEELLTRLLATPTAGTQRIGARRHRVRRWALAAAGVGVAAAVLAATSLLDSDAPGGGIVERAVAAVTQENVIYHVVERVRAEASYEPSGDSTYYIEAWHTSDGQVHQKTFASGDGRKGRLLQDVAGRWIPGRRVNPALRWDAESNTISEEGFGPAPDDGVPALDPFNDPGAQLRKLQEEGRMRVAGTARVGGTRAYRLVSGPIPHPDLQDGEERVEFLVDANTYLPLARRYSSVHPSTDPEQPISRLVVVSRFLVYERLPLNAKNRALLDLDQHPGAKCSDFAHELRGRQGVGFPNPCPPPAG